MEPQLLGQVVVVEYQCTTDDVGVAAAVLGGRVHDDVRTQLQRLLEVRRGKCVVDYHQSPGRVRQIHNRGNVSNIEQGICRRLDPDRLGLTRADCRGDGVKVGQMRRIG